MFIRMSIFFFFLRFYGNALKHLLNGEKKKKPASLFEKWLWRHQNGSIQMWDCIDKILWGDILRDDISMF